MDLRNLKKIYIVVIFPVSEIVSCIVFSKHAVSQTLIRYKAFDIKEGEIDENITYVGERTNVNLFGKLAD